MTIDELLRHARRAADELRAGRLARLPAMRDDDSRRVVNMVRRLLAGDDPTDSPD